MGRSALSGDSLNVIHVVQGCHGQDIMIKGLIFYHTINIPWEMGNGKQEMVNRKWETGHGKLEIGNW